MDIFQPSINDYLHQITPERDEVPTEIEAYARERRFPVVGPLVGSVLHQLVFLTNPTRIFEIGSGFGYSAYWMAKMLRNSKAKIVCTEGSQKNANWALTYLQCGGIANRVDYRIGDALGIRQPVSLTSSTTTSTKIAVPRSSVKRFLGYGVADYHGQYVVVGMGHHRRSTTNNTQCQGIDTTTLRLARSLHNDHSTT